MSHRNYMRAAGLLIGLLSVIVLAQAEVAPDVSIISPADGIATAQGEVQVNVAFRATANSAEEQGPTGNVIIVVLLLNGEEVGRYENPPQVKEGTHTFEVDISGLPDGAVSFEACAYQGNVKGGNVACSPTVSVVVDRTPPEISAVITPTPNANGWNNTDVSVTFECADLGSGIASCTGPSTLTSEGSNQIVTGTAVDLAGNSTSVDAVVNIDRTAPTIVAPQDPAPNAAGWNNTDVTVNFDATDDLSGIDSVTEPVTVTGEGSNQVVMGTATDVAGNSAALEVTVNIDKAPPTIQINTPVEGDTTSDSSVDLKARISDNGSGLAEVRVVHNGTLVSTQTFAGDSFFDLVATIEVEDGENVFSVQADDRSDNSSIASVTITHASNPCATITFVDANLEAAVRVAIGLPSGPITDSGVASLTVLTASVRGITDLTGSECLTSLTNLNVGDNQISDLAPLSGLTNLTTLTIRDNQISDLTALSGLFNLNGLSATNNLISDLTPLSGLNLIGDGLTLGGNQISDLTPLSGLTGLTRLRLDMNLITDLTPLSSLTNVTIASLTENQISDLGPLSSLIGLTNLNIAGNQISDLAPLSGLTNLTILTIRDNQISDLIALSGLFNLNAMSARDNLISDLTPLSGLNFVGDGLNLANNLVTELGPLSGMTGLTRLRLEENLIVDLSPLTSLNNVTIANFNGNQIVNLSPLASLVNLEHLFISNNPATDLSPLRVLPNLESLTAANNGISELGPLSSIDSLIIISLPDNLISDLSPIGVMSQMTSVGVRNNPISNIAPLLGLDNLTRVDLRLTLVSCSDPLLLDLIARVGNVSDDCP